MIRMKYGIYMWKVIPIVIIVILMISCTKTNEETGVKEKVEPLDDRPTLSETEVNDVTNEPTVVRNNPQAANERPSDAMALSLEEIEEALTRAKPGDTLWIKSGTYEHVGIVLTYNGGGTVAVRAEIPGSVTITGRSLMTIKDSENLILSGILFDRVEADNTIVLDGSSHVHITENYFYQNGRTPTSKIVGIRNGSAYNHIHHNTFEDNRGQGIALYNGHTPEDIGNVYNEIYNNLFFKVRAVSEVYPGKTNGLESVQLGQGKDVSNKFYTKVYDNLFEDNVGDKAEIISVKSSNNELYRNTFLNSNSGLTIRLGDSNQIVGNYFAQVTKGLRTYGYNQLIENNYFIGGTVGIQLPAADTRTGQQETVAAPYYQTDETRILNNVFVNTGLRAFEFGHNFDETKNYTLLPIKSEYRGNRIYMTGRGKDYEKTNHVFHIFDPISEFSNNQSYLQSEKYRGNIRSDDPEVITYTYSEQPAIPEPVEVLGYVPYDSLDIRTGAEWKRPSHES